MPEIIFSDTIVIFKKTEKIFFVNNFCGPELYIEISQITEGNYSLSKYSLPSFFQMFILGRVMLKK